MDRQTIEHTLWAAFFKSSLSKGQERKIQIVEAAIEIIAREGAETLTFDKMAKKCKVTRQLIIHHFPDREELILWGAKFVRAHMQHFAVVQLNTQTRPQKQFEAYIKSTFDWVDKNLNYANFWIYYCYFCSLKKEFKKQNSELVEMGRQRIEGLIRLGNQAKEFKCHDPKSTSKFVQNIITGSLLSYVTEDYAEIKRHLKELTVENAKKLLRV